MLQITRENERMEQNVSYALSVRKIVPRLHYNDDIGAADSRTKEEYIWNMYI